MISTKSSQERMSEKEKYVYNIEVNSMGSDSRTPKKISTSTLVYQQHVTLLKHITITQKCMPTSSPLKHQTNNSNFQLLELEIINIKRTTQKTVAFSYLRASSSVVSVMFKELY